MSTKEQLFAIVNGHLLLPFRSLANGYLLIRNGLIEEAGSGRPAELPETVIDAEGNYVAPGCIDLHVHGGGGFDFSEATPESYRAICRFHASGGTTTFYPTLAAASNDTFRKAIQVCESLMDRETGGARIAGLHFEGNYLNPRMKGGMEEQFLSLPNPEDYERFISETSCIKRWSAAPELPGALAFGRTISQWGILPSIAHTTADYATVRQAFDAGYTHATHFYNAMTSIHKEREYKKEGTVEGIYLTDGLTIELIADGIHVPPPLLELAYQIKGPDRIALVTDAMAMAGCTRIPSGLEGRMIIENGVCKLADHSALAGSMATGDQLLRTLVHQTSIPLADAVRMASATPARIMGLSDRKGSLEKGKDADLILFDDQINIKQTFVGGLSVFKT